jgi:hypothetical protein
LRTLPSYIHASKHVQTSLALALLLDCLRTPSSFRVVARIGHNGILDQFSFPVPSCAFHRTHRCLPLSGARHRTFSSYYLALLGWLPMQHFCPGVLRFIAHALRSGRRPHCACPISRTPCLLLLCDASVPSLSVTVPPFSSTMVSPLSCATAPSRRMAFLYRVRWHSFSCVTTLSFSCTTALPFFSHSDIMRDGAPSSGT